MGVKRIPLDELPANLPEEYNILVCCASFEERCTSIARKLDKEKIHKVILVANKELGEYIEPSLRVFKDLFINKIHDISLVPKSSVQTADMLRKALEEERQSKNNSYLIDISTFTHEALLILLALLKIIVKKGDRVTFIYAGASEYSIGAEGKDKWLSKGITGVQSVLGFPGNMSPGLPSHLLVLVGYEQERATKLIERLEPDFLSLGYGKSGTAIPEIHQDANQFFYELVSKSIATYKNVTSFDFSCSDPWVARDAILSQIRPPGERNIALAPMNTKISTIGAALAAWDRNDIQICYAPASMYNYVSYSRPGQFCYIFELPELLR